MVSPRSASTAQYRAQPGMALTSAGDAWKTTSIGFGEPSTAGTGTYSGLGYLYVHQSKRPEHLVERRRERDRGMGPKVSRPSLPPRVGTLVLWIVSCGDTRAPAEIMGPGDRRPRHLRETGPPRRLGVSAARPVMIAFGSRQIRAVPSRTGRWVDVIADRRGCVEESLRDVPA